MKTTLLTFILLLTLQRVSAGNPIPVASILNMDGTIAASALSDGAIDISGFHGSLDPALGPVFKPATFTPEWMYLTPGTASFIDAIAVFQGYVYVGGRFEDAGGNPDADHLARWDGCEWHAVLAFPFFPDLNIQELTVHAGNLYIGGYFYDAHGNANADNIAIWDGANLTAVGNGLNSAVKAIDVAPYGVVVAGWFSDAGGNPDADTIAIWDGTNWNELGSGLNGFPLAVHVIGNDTYVGGFFTNAGGVANTNHIARWDGTTWHALEMGLNGLVSTMTSRDDELYVGGQFTAAGGHPDANKVARWHENAWHNLGSLIPTGPGVAWSICLSGDHLYVGYSGIINQWDLDSETWDEFPPDYPGLYFVNAMAWDGEDFYVGAHNGSGETGSLYRWGEPFVQIEITGVPDTVCLNDPPLPLPTTQSGFTGNWSGPFVVNNIFDPPEAFANIQLIFTPDAPCSIAVPFVIDVVYYSEFYLDLPPTMCQNDPPYILQEEIWGISGEWSGPGVINNIFYPAGLNGDIPITFTPDSGQCLDPITNIIEVSPWVVIVITGVPDEMCESDDPVYLNYIQNGISGFWWGEGVEYPYFNPEGLSGLVTLTFEPDMGECADIVTHDIFVMEAETALISGIPDSICQLDAPLLLPVNQGGITGEWSGAGVSNNTFNPSGLLGSITLTFDPDPGTCAFSATTEIWVYIYTPQISGIPSSICVDSDPIPLPVNQSGILGNWSGPGVTMNVFDPDGLNGFVELLFSPDGGQCATTTTFSINVDSLSTPIISGVPSSICELASPIPLPVNQNGFVGNWSGPGVNMNTFDPDGQNGLIELIYTPDAGQCAAPNTHSITVNTPVAPVITGVPSSLCEELLPIPLPVIQNGFTGNWSGPGVIMNTFDPGGLNGLIELIYTPDAGQCAIAAIHIIDVFQSAIPVISGVPVSLCVEAPPVPLPEIQDGFTGNWSGPGVILNSFDPGGQNGLVELTFTPDTGQCAVEALHIIDVFQSYVPIISGVPSVICEAAAPILLPLNQDGFTGNWSGQGVSNNTFTPAGLEGNISLLFTPDAGQCGLPATAEINVLVYIQISTTVDPDTLCVTALPISLATTQDGITGTWSGAGVSNNTFSPFGQSGNVALAFTPDSGQCAFAAVDSIWVTSVVIPAIMGVPSSICASAEIITLPVVQNGITGTWSGTGVDSVYFNPSGLFGIQTVVFTPADGQCAIAVATQIDVLRSPRAQNLVAVCDSLTHTYTISFELTGGDSATYMVNGIPVEGALFTSPPIPADSINYTFILLDANECIPFAVVGQFDCSCATSAGTMVQEESPRIICIGPRFSTTHNADAHLDPDDVLMFVMHDNAGNILGNVYAVQGQSVFTFMPGMIAGQVYFISSVAGNNDGTGGVDLQDPCLSVSPGVPVIFKVCEPDEDNDGMQPIDRNPFAGDEDDKYRQANTFLHSAGEGKIEIRYSTMLISNQEMIIDATWAFLEREDPLAVIRAVTMYDLWGRKVMQRQGVSLSALMSVNGIADVVPGYYVLTADIDQSNGKAVQVIGRCLVQ